MSSLESHKAIFLAKFLAMNKRIPTQKMSIKEIEAYRQGLKEGYGEGLEDGVKVGIDVTIDAAITHPPMVSPSTEHNVEMS